jgi:hypothetical protein
VAHGLSQSFAHLSSRMDKRGQVLRRDGAWLPASQVPAADLMTQIQVTQYTDGEEKEGGKEEAEGSQAGPGSAGGEGGRIADEGEEEEGEGIVAKGAAAGAAARGGPRLCWGDTFLARLLRGKHRKRQAASYKALTSKTANPDARVRDGITLTYGRAACLRGTTMLNDEVLNDVLDLLKARRGGGGGGARRAGSLPRPRPAAPPDLPRPARPFARPLQALCRAQGLPVEVYNTFFYAKLVPEPKAFNFAAVARWSKRCRLQAGAERMVTAVHLPNKHWLAALVDLRRKIVTVLDSCRAAVSAGRGEAGSRWCGRLCQLPAGLAAGPPTELLPQRARHPCPPVTPRPVTRARLLRPAPRRPAIRARSWARCWRAGR